MILSSSDPLNFILACLWSLLLLSFFVLTWYAYVRWRRNPNDSLSHRIAVWLKFQSSFKDRLLLGYTLGLLIGSVIGFIVGLFTGHWFWPVEL